MPKNKDFAQELKEEFTRGNLKPSQLKKSHSSEDISKPPLTPPLQKSKSAEELSSPQLNLVEQIKRLKEELAFTECTAQNYLERLQLLTAELDNQEGEFEERVKGLEQEKNALVEQNLELRLKALKDFSEIRENQQGITEAVERLVKTEQKQINYQVQNRILLREKGDLQKQLQVMQERLQRVYQLKGLPSTAKADLPLGFQVWALFLVGWGIWIVWRDW